MSEKSFNINNSVKVKLTEKGKAIYAQQWGKEPETDEGGCTSFQLWCLMEMFGEYMYCGMDAPFETTIIVDENDLQDVEVEE